jgi:hypothetical protein
MTNYFKNETSIRCCDNNKDNHLELLKKLIVKETNPFTCLSILSEKLLKLVTIYVLSYYWSVMN